MPPSVPLKDIVVIYHAQCRDGFGSAYAAWKIFGDRASYIPRKTQDPVVEGLANKEIYIVDYSYPKDVLVALRANNTKVVVIDHHASARETIESFAENVYAENHSGAVLTWQYFHPTTPVPRLLEYIEDHDLWRMTLPHTREFGAALGQYVQDFETWDQLNRNLEDREHFNSFIAHGEIIARFEDSLVEKILSFKERARFEEHDVYVLNAERIYRSILGNRLALLNQSEGRIGIGIVYYRYDGAVHCSLRSLPEVDVRTIAERFGGGGHKNAASVRVPSFTELPFTLL